MSRTCTRLFLSGLAFLVSAAVVPPSSAAAQQWASVDAGRAHACALDADGRAYCWGGNHQGQLGASTPDECRPIDGTTESLCTPGPSTVPVAVSGGHRFRMIRAGYAQTCGLTIADELLCWGYNYGPRPTTPAHAAGRRYYAISAANSEICGAEQPSGGRCWDTRQLAWQTLRELPNVRYHTVAAASAPNRRFCGLTLDGKLLCTGYNRKGQLGVLSPDSTAEYVEPVGNRWYRQVAMNADWTCGLTIEGRVFCWGDFLRARPWGSPPESAETCWSGVRCIITPRPVAPEIMFAEISASYDDMCGITAAGALHCWKQDGVVTQRAGGLRFRTISGGGIGWCGVSQARDLYCWDPGNGDANPVPIPRPNHRG